MFLPYWNSEIHVEIPSWFPWGKDYQPVSINRFYNTMLRDIAAFCFDLDSEFYFMASPLVGSVGSLPRIKYFQDNSENTLPLGFLMLFAYSETIEKALVASVSLNDAAKELSLGLVFCYIWREGVLEGKVKAIAVASNSPFYDCDEYLHGLVSVLFEIRKIVRPSALSYYAEKLGYNRFSFNWEKDDYYSITTTQILSEIENAEAKEIVGGPPIIEFPPFFGKSITAVEK